LEVYMDDGIDRRRGPCPLCGRDAEIARTITALDSGQPNLGRAVAVGCSTFGCGNFIHPEDLTAE
jgi:hypothetical protein